jgi:hypothetical protein
MATASRPTTAYRQCKEYGGIKFDQTKKFKGMEEENVRLKNLSPFKRKVS